MIFRVKELATTLARLEPYAMQEAQRIATNREKSYAALTKAKQDERDKHEQRLKFLDDHVSDEVARANRSRGWWQRKIRVTAVKEKVVRDWEYELREGLIDASRDFHDSTFEADTLTGTLSYLEALCERLDPEATIALSDQETFNINRMMDLEDVAKDQHEGT